MGAKVHRVVSKVDFANSRVRTEFDPDNNWLIVEGPRDVTIVERFRAREGKMDFPITDWNPNDTIRIRVRRDKYEIRISLDREEGGAWWKLSENPTLAVRFDSSFQSDRKIHVVVKGGDLKEPINLGEVALLPPAKPAEKR